MSVARHIARVKADAAIVAALHHQREEIALAGADLEDVLSPEPIPWINLSARPSAYR